MDTIVQRAKNAHKLMIIVILIFWLNSYSQNVNADEGLSISSEEYEVLNAYYKDENSILKIYHKTQFDKGWSIYFYENDNINFITKNRGLGSYITNEELARLFSQEKCTYISSKIMSLKPIKLNQKKITGANLVKSFDNPNDDNVIRISKPIIIDDLAVFRATESLCSNINVLQRKNNRWEHIYTINEWLILID